MRGTQKVETKDLTARLIFLMEGSAKREESDVKYYIQDNVKIKVIKCE